MADPIRTLARTFALIGANIASDVHNTTREGIPEDVQHELTNAANKALFADMVERGEPVWCVRDRSGFRWCGVVLIDDKLKAACDGRIVEERKAVKHMVSCDRCKTTVESW